MNLNIISKQNILKVQLISIITIIFLFLILVYLPLHNAINKIKRDNTSKFSALKEIISLSNTYKALNLGKKTSSLNNLNSDNLVTFIQNILKQLDIEKNLVSITPSTRKIDNNTVEKFLDIKLESLGLKEALGFLESIYKTRQLEVSRLNIERNQKKTNTITIRLLIKAKTGYLGS